MPTSLGVYSLVIFALVSGSCSTGRNMLSTEATALKVQDSLIVDRDGNKYPIQRLSDHKLWMTTNLKLSVPDSYCYGDDAENCSQYGRLYLWQSASAGCRLLGKGWRLPVKEEWQRMAALYGSSDLDPNQAVKKAFLPLLVGGSSPFNAVLGGGRDLEGKYARIEAHGFYWTATATDTANAWFANFAKGSQALFLQKDGEKNRAFSVRCLKD